MPVTGNRPFNGRTFACDVLNAPIVTQAELEDATHPINLHSMSGKQRGAITYVQLTSSGDLTTAVAQGANPEDTWVFHDPSNDVQQSPVFQGLRTRLETLESEYLILQGQMDSLNLDNGGGG